MTIQQLQYFAALAKYLHFGDAAKSCYVSQPSLSKAISELEKELDADLISRNNKVVELTPAGKQFYRDTKELLRLMDEAIMNTKRLNDGICGELKINFLRTYAFSYFADFVNEFRKRHPEIDVQLCQEGLHATSAGLLSGDIDVALTYDIEVASRKNEIAWHPIAPTRYCIVMRKDNPLARRKNVTLESLKNERFVFIDRNEIPNAFKDTMRLCAARGLKPNIAYSANKIDLVCTMVRAGMGIAILPDTTKVYSLGSLKFIEIDGDDALTYSGLAWKFNHNNPATSLFLREFGVKL